jgi:predicted CoA-binding protein
VSHPKAEIRDLPEETIAGRPMFRRVWNITERGDVVDVFRRSDEWPNVVHDVPANRAPALGYRPEQARTHGPRLGRQWQATCHKR